MKSLTLLCVLLFSGCNMVLSATTRVAIEYDVPPALSAYSGKQPVTFGVPFERGVLHVDDSVTVVDANGNKLPAQFEISATWSSEGQQVRWLLVDTVADIQNGNASPTFLSISKGGRAIAPSSELSGNTFDTKVGSRRIQIGRQKNSLGRFTLVDGSGRAFHPTGEFNIELERTGPVRTVVKTTTKYVDAQGNSIADAITRYRFYPGEPFVRIYHTMIWQVDDSITIGELRFDTTEQLSDGPASVGLDGKVISGKNVTVKQTGASTAAGDATGKQIDGWVQVRNDKQSLFGAVRWPWQQFPTRVSAKAGQLSIGLIGPDQPMSLKPADIAVPTVQPPRVFSEWDIQDIVNGAKKVEQISPRGVAKTWELLLWFGDKNDAVTPQQKNAILQTPVFAYADPAFATRASLPNPMSPHDPERFPLIEASLSRTFDWFSQPLERDGDFGTWNYGDVQWQWTMRGWPIYRYWMNQGKGWSVVPWVLYLRSGDRRYLDFGEAHARHVMDVDTCHVPEWKVCPDGKRRAAPYSYSAMHWSSGPFLAEFQAESEYLQYCYYMTGYERARDVMMQIVEALARFEYDEKWLKDFRSDRLKAHRHLYAMVKELGVLYEATWDERLKGRLDEYFDLTLKAPNPDGNFPNVRTNHYLSQPLNIAERIYGPQRILPVMKKWQAYRGDVDRVGTTGSIVGPMSLWTLVTLGRLTNDPHYLDLAARTARTQAWVVVDGDTEWRGMPPTWGPETGPHLRDWVVTMAAMAQQPEVARSDRLLAMPSLHGRLPVSKADQQAGWKWRHVMLVLDEQDTELAVDVFGLNRAKCLLRVIDPTGRLVKEQPEDFSKFQGAAATARVVLPADQQKGVYAIELLTPDRFPDVILAGSSSGRLLHLLSDKQATFLSSAYAGQIWAVPIGNKDVVINRTQNRYFTGRAVIRNEQGDVLAKTKITGTRTEKVSSKSRVASGWQLKGKPCTLPAAEADPNQLLQLILPTSSVPHLWWSITGIQPYVATTREQWFDPTSHRHPDIAALVKVAG